MAGAGSPLASSVCGTNDPFQGLFHLLISERVSERRMLGWLWLCLQEVPGLALEMTLLLKESGGLLP